MLLAVAEEKPLPINRKTCLLIRLAITVSRMLRIGCRMPMRHGPTSQDYLWFKTTWVTWWWSKKKKWRQATVEFLHHGCTHHTALLLPGHHQNNGHLLLPHHAPEVVDCRVHWPLRGDVLLCSAAVALQYSPTTHNEICTHSHLATYRTEKVKAPA